MLATGAKLMERMNAPTITSDRIPPRLSTGSVVSLTCGGTNSRAMMKAITAIGTTTMNTELHE